jgi:hypothetical protein
LLLDLFSELSVFVAQLFNCRIAIGEGFFQLTKPILFVIFGNQVALRSCHAQFVDPPGPCGFALEATFFGG